MSKKKTRKEFPNDWKFYKQLKPKHYRQVPFNEFVQQRLNGWQLLPNIGLLVKTHNLDTGLIQEVAFESEKDFKKFLKTLAVTGCEFDLLCNNHEKSFLIQLRQAGD